MDLFVGCSAIHDGFWPVGDWESSVSEGGDGVKRYEAIAEE